MKCVEFRELLADYLGDETAAADRGRLAQHRAACPACDAAARGLEQAASVVAANLREFDARGAVEDVRAPLVLHVARRSPWGSIAAALAVLAAFGVGYAARGSAAPTAAPPGRADLGGGVPSDALVRQFRSATASHPQAGTLGHVLLTLARP